MSDDRYSVRWKGKTLGPLSRREIERKIQDQEFGMLHEIWTDGQWITLKEFFGPKQNSLFTPRPRKDSEAETDHSSDSAGESVSPENTDIDSAPPPVWLMSGYLADFVLLFLAMLGWTQTWTAPSGWAPILGLGLGLVGGLFGLLTYFQEEKKHGILIVAISILLAFANMMFT